MFVDESSEITVDKIREDEITSTLCLVVDNIEITIGFSKLDVKAKKIDSILIGGNDSKKIPDLIKNEALWSLEKNRGILEKYETYHYRLNYYSGDNTIYNSENIEAIENTYIKAKASAKLAVKNFEDSIRVLQNNDTFESTVEMVLLYLHKRKYDLAFSAGFDYINKNGYNTRLCYVVALAAILNNSYVVAIKLCRMVVSCGQANDAIYFISGLANYILGNKTKSFEDFSISININNFNKNSIIMLYELRSFNNKVYDVLYYALTRIKDYVKNDVELTSIYASILLRMNKVALAIDVVNTCLIVFSDNVVLWHIMALIYIKRREHEKVVIAFEKALQNINFENHSNVIYNFMVYNYNCGEYSNVIAIYHKLKLNELDVQNLSKHEYFHQLYFSSLLKSKRNIEYENCANDYFQILSLAPFSAVEIAADLMCYYSTQNVDFKKTEYYINYCSEKLSALKKTLKLKVVNNIVFSLLEHGDVMRASSYIPIFTGIMDRNPYLNATYGLYWFRNNDISRGQKFYDRAISYESNSILRQRLIIKRDYETAVWYKNNGNKSQSKKLIKKIIDTKVDFYVVEIARREMLTS